MAPESPHDLRPRSRLLSRSEDQCTASARTPFDNREARCVGPAGHRGKHYDADLRHAWEFARELSEGAK